MTNENNSNVSIMKDYVYFVNGSVNDVIPMTNSTIIATEFGKTHKNVLRDARKLREELRDQDVRLVEKYVVDNHGDICSSEYKKSVQIGQATTGTLLNNDQIGQRKIELSSEEPTQIYVCEETTKKSKQNKDIVEIRMNEDFFALLVMGYTGKKALTLKVKIMKYFRIGINAANKRYEARQEGYHKRLDFSNNFDSKGDSFAQAKMTNNIYQACFKKNARAIAYDKGLSVDDKLRDNLTQSELNLVRHFENSMVVLGEHFSQREAFKMTIKSMTNKGMIPVEIK